MILHEAISISKLFCAHGCMEGRASCWVADSVGGNDSFSECDNETLRSPLVSIYVVILTAFHSHSPFFLVISIDGPDCMALTHWLGLLQVSSAHEWHAFLEQMSHMTVCPKTSSSSTIKSDGGNWFVFMWYEGVFVCVFIIRQYRCGAHALSSISAQPTKLPVSVTALRVGGASSDLKHEWMRSSNTYFFFEIYLQAHHWA